MQSKIRPRVLSKTLDVFALYLLSFARSEARFLVRYLFFFLKHCLLDVCACFYVIAPKQHLTAWFVDNRHCLYLVVSALACLLQSKIWFRFFFCQQMLLLASGCFWLLDAKQDSDAWVVSKSMVVACFRLFLISSPKARFDCLFFVIFSFELAVVCLFLPAPKPEMSDFFSKKHCVPFCFPPPPPGE